MWLIPYLVLAALIAIFALRNRDDPRTKLRRWRLIQLMILVWLLLELQFLCR